MSSRDIVDHAVSRVAFRLHARRASWFALVGGISALPVGLWLSRSGAAASGVAVVAGVALAAAAAGWRWRGARASDGRSEAASRLDAAYGLDDLVVSARAADGPLARYVVASAAQALEPRAPWRDVVHAAPGTIAALATLFAIALPALIGQTAPTEPARDAASGPAADARAHTPAARDDTPIARSDTPLARSEPPPAPGDRPVRDPDAQVAPTQAPFDPERPAGSTIAQPAGGAPAPGSHAADAPGAASSGATPTRTPGPPVPAAAPAGTVEVATPRGARAFVPEAVPPRYRALVADYLAARARRGGR